MNTTTAEVSVGDLPENAEQQCRQALDEILSRAGDRQAAMQVLRDLHVAAWVAGSGAAAQVFASGPEHRAFQLGRQVEAYARQHQVPADTTAKVDRTATIDPASDHEPISGWRDRDGGVCLCGRPIVAGLDGGYLHADTNPDLMLARRMASVADQAAAAVAAMEAHEVKVRNRGTSEETHHG